MTIKLLLTGAEGQLGATFQQHWAESSLANVYHLECCDIDDVDLSDEVATTAYLNHKQPSVIVNAAAYTAVDRAEEESDLAYKVNALAVQHLATWCAQQEARLVQLSTDFVFSGDKSIPYTTEDIPAPISVYGASKLAGEQQVQEILPNSGIIIRTSWLYSEYGNNFVKTMLRLMSNQTELGIVSDQIGSPTSTHSLVRALYCIIESGSSGIYHWSDGAAISWYDFAVEIQTKGLESGLLDNHITLNKLSTAEYPTPAARPAYSVMDINKTLALLNNSSRSWKSELEDVITLLASN